VNRGPSVCERNGSETRPFNCEQANPLLAISTLIYCRHKYIVTEAIALQTASCIEEVNIFPVALSQIFEKQLKLMWSTFYLMRQCYVQYEVLKT
jgi:hypothetical protein